MSASLGRWARAQRTGLVTRKLVLLCLAIAADSRGRAVITRKQLATECEISEMSVIRAMRWLVDNGIVRREPPRPGERQNGPRQTLLQLDRRPPSDGLA